MLILTLVYVHLCVDLDPTFLMEDQWGLTELKELQPLPNASVSLASLSPSLSPHLVDVCIIHAIVFYVPKYN